MLAREGREVINLSGGMHARARAGLPVVAAGGHPAGWREPVIVLAVAAGLLIGASLGALGGGRSILTVPALVYLLGQSAHQATAASLTVVGTAAAVGALAHARGGRVRLKAGATFGILGIAGSCAGSRASAAVPASGRADTAARVPGVCP